MSMLTEINFYIREEPYGWMSNFERSQQIMDSWTYKTNEHFYQSRKATDPEAAMWIANAPTAHLAMIAGRALSKKELRSDWEAVKVDVMLTGLRAKFGQNDVLRKFLIDTGDLPIHEESPTDMVWGKKGQDLLGRLLMHVREELKTGQQKPFERIVALSSTGKYK